VGKGTLAALNRAQQFARGHRYVLQLDVREFFPSIDHAVLETTLARHLADQRVLDLCHRIIAGGRDLLAEEYTPVLFPGDDLFALLRPRGLPIGNLTSQFWANVMLHPLDLFIKQTLRCRAYLRYCDDLLLFADDKATLHAWRDTVCDELAPLVCAKRCCACPSQRCAMPDSPIFARCDELVLWVLRATVRYPRPYRAALGRATQEGALLLQRELIAAARRKDRRVALQAADEALSELRILLRQSHTLKLLSVGQYEHAARLADEVGRLLGGWRKAQARAATGGAEAAERSHIADETG
jgi:hypothetical protein